MKLEFDNLKELLAFNIKYYRYVAGISQEQLAELCDFTPRSITNIECCRSTPNILKWDIIAKSLNIEPFQLIVNCERDKTIIDKMNSSRQYNQKK